MEAINLIPHPVVKAAAEARSYIMELQEIKQPEEHMMAPPLMVAGATSDMMNKEEVDQLEEYMMAHFGKFDTSASSNPNEPYSTIYRVLPFIREGYEKEYDPSIISIGPFHFDKMRSTFIEQLKSRYLHDFLNRISFCEDVRNRLIKSFIGKVVELEKQIRAKYGEEIQLTSYFFIQMMVMDICFVLELLIKNFLDDEKLMPLLAVNWKYPLITKDLLLLENQIPFFVLQSLFDLSPLNLQDPKTKEPISLLQLAVKFVYEDNYMHSHSSEVQLGKIVKVAREVHHLLHLSQLFLRPTSTSDQVTNGGLWRHNVKHIGWEMVSDFFLWLLFKLSMLFSCQLFRWRKFPRSQTDEESSYSQPYFMFPNATELKECGVKFVKKKEPRNQLDVSFNRGVMEIPMLFITDSTNSALRNLLAFEQCCPQSGSHILSYVKFLDNLIDTEGDVAVLKKHGIIVSLLGEDKQVADIFNKLDYGTYLDSKHHLNKLFKQVKDYSEASYRRWRAKLMEDYFGNPWSTISLLAAVVLLLFTLVQTIYAVKAYYYPPK